MIKLLKGFLLGFIPRYVTDRVALSVSSGGIYSVYCLECQVKPCEKDLITCYGTLRTLTWFGIAAGGKVVLDVEVDKEN